MSSPVATLILVLMLTEAVVLNQSCNEGDVRLSDGLEGRVQLCYTNQWSKVCFVWGHDNQDVTCRQLGLLRSTMEVGLTEFGDGQNTTYAMTGIDCNGHEATLADCGYQRLDRGCFRSATARCMEGAQPVNVGYIIRDGGTKVALMWDPPSHLNVSQRIAESLNRNRIGYTASCTSVDQYSQNLQVPSHSIAASVSNSTFNVTLTGLRLMEFDYNCFVSTDYANFHPKSFFLINRTEVEEAVTESTSSSASTSATSMTSNPSHTTRIMSSPDPTSSSNFIATAAVGGVLGAVVVMLLITTIGLCAYYKQWTRKSGGIRLGDLRSQQQQRIENDGTLSLQPSMKHHTYEVIDPNHVNQTPQYTSAPTANESSVIVQERDRLPSKRSSQNPGDARTGNSQYEVVDGPEDDITVKLLPANGQKGQNGHQYELVDELSDDKHVLNEEIRGNYKVLEEPSRPQPPRLGSPYLTAVSKRIDGTEMTQKSGRYEFASDLELNEATGTLDQKYMNLAQGLDSTTPDPQYINQTAVVSERYEFADAQTEEQILSSRYEFSDDHKSNFSKGDNKTAKPVLYINIEESATEVQPEIDEDVQRRYSHIDLLDATESSPSYSHIAVLKDRPRSRLETQSQGDLSGNKDVSHRYSHINTANPSPVSPGYFHLDTSKVKADQDKLLLSSMKPQQSKENDYVGYSSKDDHKAKGYACLEISGSEVRDDYVDVVGCEDGMMVVTGDSGDGKSCKNNTDTSQVQNQQQPTLTGLDVSEMKQQADPQQILPSTRFAYFHIPHPDNHENPPPTNPPYSRLNIDELQDLCEGPQQAFPPTSSPYSHLNLDELQDHHEGPPPTSSAYSHLNIDDSQDHHHSLDAAACNDSYENVTAGRNTSGMDEDITAGRNTSAMDENITAGRNTSAMDIYADDSTS